MAFDENDSFLYCAHISLFIDASNCRASACSTKLATTFCNMSFPLNGLTVDLLCSTCSSRILSDVKPRNMDHKLSTGVAYRLLWCHCRAFWYRIVVLLKERISLCFITVCCVANSDGCRFRLEQHVYPVCYKRFVDGGVYIPFVVPKPEVRLTWSQLTSVRIVFHTTPQESISLT